MKIREYDLPDGLYYTRDHVWVKVEGECLRVGITDVMQKLAGDITFIRLPRAGRTLEVGKTLATLQSGKWAGAIKVPMAGTIVDTNRELVGDPTRLNRSPYGEGWIAVLEPQDIEAGLGALLTGPAVQDWLEGELDSLDEQQ